MISHQHVSYCWIGAPLNCARSKSETLNHSARAREGGRRPTGREHCATVARTPPPRGGTPPRWETVVAFDRHFRIEPIAMGRAGSNPSVVSRRGYHDSPFIDVHELGAAKTFFRSSKPSTRVHSSPSNSRYRNTPPRLLATSSAAPFSRSSTSRVTRTGLRKCQLRQATLATLDMEGTTPSEPSTAAPG
jgi:hypothetical protein